MSIEGSTKASAFESYVEQILAPRLQAGHLVVMDNLSAHKGQRVREAIQARGAQLLFLPSDSADPSPIEEAFSKGKTFLRSVGAGTREELVEALSRALETITSHDARGYFPHCGYFPADQQR